MRTGGEPRASCLEGVFGKLMGGMGKVRQQGAGESRECRQGGRGVRGHSQGQRAGDRQKQGVAPDGDSAELRTHPTLFPAVLVT